MTKNSQILLGLLSVVSLALLGLIVFGVYDIRVKNIETSTLLSEAGQVAEIGSIAQSIKVLKSSTIEDVNLLNRLALTNDNLVPLIESIESKGRSLNLVTSIASVERNKAAESTEPDKIRMVIEAEGALAGTFTLLQAIESLPHRVVIDDVSLLEVSEGWHLRVVLLLYIFD